MHKSFRLTLALLVALILVSCQPAVGVVVSVVIDGGDLTVDEGETAQLTVTVTVTGAASKAVVWSSSDDGVVSISAGGLITGEAPGTADITATSVFDGTVSGSIEVTVEGVVPIVVSVDLAGDQEVPVVPTAAFGQATVTVTGTEMVVDGSWEGMVVAAPGAHVHGPAAVGTNAGIVFILTYDNDAQTFGGTFELSALQLSDFEHGLLYLNLHSAAYPGGEIRGQILPDIDH